MAETARGVVLSQTQGMAEGESMDGLADWALYLLSLQQSSHVLAVIEPENIRLHWNFPAASWSARLVVVKN